MRLREGVLVGDGITAATMVFWVDNGINTSQLGRNVNSLSDEDR